MILDKEDLFKVPVFYLDPNEPEDKGLWKEARKLERAGYVTARKSGFRLAELGLVEFTFTRLGTALRKLKGHDLDSLADRRISRQNVGKGLGR